MKTPSGYSREALLTCVFIEFSEPTQTLFRLGHLTWRVTKGFIIIALYFEQTTCKEKINRIIRLFTNSVAILMLNEKKKNKFMEETIVADVTFVSAIADDGEPEPMHAATVSLYLRDSEAALPFRELRIADYTDSLNHLDMRFTCRHWSNLLDFFVKVKQGALPSDDRRDVGKIKGQFPCCLRVSVKRLIRGARNEKEQEDK